MSLSAVAAMPTPRQRRRDVLDVIRGLRRDHSRADEARLVDLLVEELMDDRELLRAVAGDLVHKALAPAKVKARPTIKAAETSRRQRVAHQNTERAAVTA